MEGQISQKFKNLVDEMVLTEMQKDQELEDAIIWIDKEAAKLGLDFYQTVDNILKKAEAIKKARDWMESK